MSDTLALGDPAAGQQAEWVGRGTSAGIRRKDIRESKDHEQLLPPH